MSIVDLVQAADGCLVLAENAHPSHEYVCPTCTKRLKYKTRQDKGFFSHLPGESQACRAALPKTNYHRVLTTCQTRYKWILHVECATPACAQEVDGPYTVSREGAYKIIVRALRTHQYHVKAGCDRFGIKSKLCDACKARTKPAPTTPPHPVPVQTTIAEAESVAAQATTTQRAAALSAHAALDQHVAARGQRVVAEREEKIAFDQHQMAIQRRIEAQTFETTTRELSQSASNILAAATTAENVAVANVKQVRESNNAAAELERQRVAASEAAELERVHQNQQKVDQVEAVKVEARVQAFGQIEALIEGGANSTVSLVHQWEWLEVENVAAQELERVASESVGGWGPKTHRPKLILILLHLLYTEPVLPFQTTTDAPLVLTPRWLKLKTLSGQMLQASYARPLER